ncbi:bromodomain-containing protein 7 isoform X7 [Phycodurus eques]|uniref:bromodomain-containing protein 7 isoform X7 n=1 Tax=Phycodurus eques TaxID=693459 RepID=UPI002ACD38E8|nr:bromodomain-containing protein 7 isoform X7 [Phycodurus eques]
MGKKHKKHKSEKHAYEEYAERPLKLVLKVSGNEVTTGSSSRDTFYDEQSPECDKGKDKKKKKKKDKERNCGTPDSDKGKKKVIKKKKGHDRDGEDERDNCRTPIRSELDKLEAEKELTPLQEALNQLIRQLQRKDPSAFFTFPVTDLIAPGYSIIIKQPMDFSTMKEKVKKQSYVTLDELKADFRTMCENAMVHNKPETIYHKAARKLLHSGMKILNKERLESLKQSIEFMSGLDPSDKAAWNRQDQGAACLVTKREASTEGSERSQTPGTPRPDKEAKEEGAEKELEKIRKVIEESRGKLSNRVLQCDLEFSRQRQSDGSTTLAFVNPADPSAGEPTMFSCDCFYRGGILPYQTRHDVHPPAERCELPAGLPRGQEEPHHSSVLHELRAVHVLRARLRLQLLQRRQGRLRPHLQLLRGRVQPAGVGQAFQPDAWGCSETELPAAEELSGADVQQKLDETTRLLRELQEAQRERLSTKQPPNMICLLAPTTKELELAERVTGNLAALTGRVAPRDISSIWAIRKAMGIALPLEALVDLTTVRETAEPMDTMPSCQDAPPIAAV